MLKVNFDNSFRFFIPNYYEMKRTTPTWIEIKLHKKFEKNKQDIFIISLRIGKKILPAN